MHQVKKLEFLICNQGEFRVIDLENCYIENDVASSTHPPQSSSVLIHPLVLTFYHK